MNTAAYITLVTFFFLANMKTISAIYARCLTSLNDDWLSSPEGNNDMEDGAVSIFMNTHCMYYSL